MWTWLAALFGWEGPQPAQAFGREYAALAALLVTSLVPPVIAASQHATPQAPVAPQRIASMVMLADEVLLELVEPRRLAAVTRFIDDPSMTAATAPSSIGRLHGTPEETLAVAPDLVVLSDLNTPEHVALLERAGISTVKVAAPVTLDEVMARVLQLGAAVGERPRAEALVQASRARLARVAARRCPERPRVLLLGWTWAYGLGTLQDDWLRAAGARNVAAEAGLRGPTETSEELWLDWDPDVILLESADHAVKRGTELPGGALTQQLRAVRTKRVYAFPRPYGGSISHHVVRAVELAADLWCPTP